MVEHNKRISEWVEKMDRGQHMSQRRGRFFILNENPT